MVVSMHHKRKKRIKDSLIKTISKYSLLFLLLLSFYTEQVLVFSIYERDKYETLATFQFDQYGHQYNLFLKEEIPSQHFISAVEMEGEEDSLSNTPEVSTAIGFHRPGSFEFQYRSMIRTRYLQLLARFDDQPVEPLFVLHHSWKERIS